MRVCFLLMSLIMSSSRIFRSALSAPLGVGIASSLLLLGRGNGVASCSSASEANPLLDKRHLPRFDKIQPQHVVPAVDNDLNQLKRDFSNLVVNLEENKAKKVTTSYEKVVEELERIQAPLSFSWGVVGHLMGVKNSDELRKAHDELQPAVIETHQQIGQNALVFEAFRQLKEQESEWAALDRAQRRILDSSIKQMHLSGVDLPPAQREAFNKLQLEAAELSTRFSNNVLDSTKQFKLRLTDEREIAGLPQSARALAAQKAKQEGDENATAEQGPWVLTLDMPCYLPCMQHLQSREIRERLYRAYVTRASRDALDNTPVIHRLLQLRTEMARLLGFHSHAEKSLATKMADSVAEVEQLLEMLRERSFPAAQRELAELRAFARAQGFSESEIALWDVPYWSERQREKQYAFKEEELREYLAYPEVLKGLFTLAQRLFNVRITEAPTKSPLDANNTSNEDAAPVWHPDVKFYHIHDNATGEHIASFYLDPYSRPGEKRGGAWMNVCLGKSRVLQHKPVAYLVCNGAPPVGDQPSLMSFREVETLFHEFGHGLQHMLTSVPHGDAAGINNIEWDAVELPSQFMENWCYDEKTLYSFAKHYQTGEALPRELFAKLKAAKNFQAGMMMLRQLYFASLDLALHSTPYDGAGAEVPGAAVFDVQRRLAERFTVVPPLQEDRFLCSFSHIFAGGYSAGYYSYKWAEVMSADAFAAFEEAGLEDEQAVRETGRRFRETVLSLGGGEHPSDVYKAFRGRAPSPEALLRHSGLVDEQKK